jgi:hypothetical protein
MAKSKLGRNPFQQLKTTPVEQNPLFANNGAETPTEADPIGVLFAAEPDESLDAEIDEQRTLGRTAAGLTALGLLKGYALMRGLMIR